jgi:dynein heavy chain
MGIFEKHKLMFSF